MKINVKELKNVLSKATLNNSIENVRLTFTKDTVTSNMISANRDVIVRLNMDNEVIKEDAEFNFINPNKDLTPFLNLLNSEEEVDIVIKDEKIALSSGTSKMSIHFCAPQVVSVFEGQMDMDIVPFYEMVIDEVFIDAFNKIKKIAPSYGNIYFSVIDGSFLMEALDKDNKFSNVLSIELNNKLAKGIDNVTLCFDYKNFNNLISVVNGDAEDFQLEFYYIENHGAGMLQTKKNDESEQYSLMSITME